MTNLELGRKIWKESIKPDKPKRQKIAKIRTEQAAREPILLPGFVLKIKPGYIQSRKSRLIM